MEDEQLPDIADGGGGENGQEGHDDDENEELRSIGDSPVSPPQPQGTEDEGRSSNESDSEELVSISDNSPQDGASTADADNQDSDQGLPDLPSIPNSPEPEPEAGPSNRREDQANGNNAKGPSAVRRFRTRVDENGEVVYEFACDEGEELKDQNEDQDEQESSPLPRFNAFEDGEEELEEYYSSSDDSDYLPGQNIPDISLPFDVFYGGGIGTRVANRRGGAGHRLGNGTDEQPSRGRGRPRVPGPSRGGGRGRPRRRRAVSRRKTAKKTQPSTPKKPPKPLAPKTVTQKEFVDEESELFAADYGENFFGWGYLSRIKLQGALDESCDDLVKVGQVSLQFSSPVEGLETIMGEDGVLQMDGFKHVWLHVNSRKDYALVETVSEKTLSEEEAARRPKPKLSRQDLRRQLILVLQMKCYKPCHIEEFPQELFSHQGLGNAKVFQLHVAGLDTNEPRPRLRLEIKLQKEFIFASHGLEQIPCKQPKILRNLFNRLFDITGPPEMMEEGEVGGKASVSSTQCDETEGLDAGGYQKSQKRDPKEDIPWFYGQIRKYHDQEVLPTPPFSVQPEKVRPVLRPYQRDAVQWMLHREGVIGKPSETNPQINLKKAFLSKMYRSVELGGATVYYNPYVGYLCTELPLLGELPSGGILADEMGLGKTVEAICLVLLNPRPMEDTKILNSTSVVKLDNSDLSDSEYEDVSYEQGEEDSNDSDGSYKPSHSIKGRGSNLKRSTPLEPKSVSEPFEVSDAPMVHPRLRRKRNLSPCTFTTNAEPEDESNRASQAKDLVLDLVDDQLQDDKEEPLASAIDGNDSLESSDVNYEFKPTVPTPSTSKDAAVIDEEPRVRNAADESTGKTKVPSPARPRGRKRSVCRSSEPTPTKRRKQDTEPRTTYERVKAIYEAELARYSEVRNVSKSTFHGTFFDTKIARIARFECICGGREDRRRVVTCSMCRSSQHAECVGFTEKLPALYAQMGLEYQCPHCIAIGKPYPCKTTLIVTPNSISHQWIKELQRHVKKNSMSILFYKGVSQHGYIPPLKLGEYDVVLTTYGTLSAEVNYIDLPHTNSEDGRRFRNAKRFMTIPSPLPCVEWWRVVLDEAQMVEGIATRMSIMTRKLPSIHKWCVTGTPINHGLQDLLGLYAFLGVEPIAVDFWWQKLVQQPFARKDVSLLYELFGQLIWRTGKMDVLDQLGIPSQTSLVRWLKFSAVEGHFYKQQYEMCSKKILENIHRLRQSNKDILECRLSALDRQTLQKLLLPFLELRKACCHPQTVKGQTISLQKGTMTMEELLAQLIKNTSLQCTDDHRQVVAALNGMAGIHIIKEEWLLASEKYREVLQSAEKNKEHFKTDTLQLLHTMENLADLLDRHHHGIPYTLRDSSLGGEAEELKRKYLGKHANNVKSAKAMVDPLTKLADDLSNEFKCPEQYGHSWWAMTLSKAARIGKIDDLVKRCKDELADVTKKRDNYISLANKFHDANSLEYALIRSITDIESMRRSALEGLDKLQQDDPSIFVHAAVSCHLRKKSQFYYKESDEVGFRCQMCQYHDKFIEYESNLFKEEKKQKVIRTGRKWQQQKIMGEIASDLTDEQRNLVLLKEEEELMESLADVNVQLSDEMRRGTWGDSETEKILKLVNNFSRINRLPQEVLADGNTHVKLFEAMKKEFRLLRILWRQLYDQVSAHDELSQATTRLCLKYVSGNQQPAEEAGPSGSSRRKRKPRELASGILEQDQRIQNINVVERHELDARMIQMQADLETGKNELSTHMGQLLYLETLKKTDYGKKGTRNSDACPVCHNQLGEEWSVLRCGHSYCCDCVKQMCPHLAHQFLCPLCRTPSKYADVSFVNTREDTAGESASSSPKKVSNKIKGSHSTKVEAVLETVLHIMETKPGEKMIIFSSWVDVLEIISKALKQNDVSNSLLTQAGKKFHTELEIFKQREDMQVLLMPLASGSKGLNIIEATHVLLVEPILSLASELQAIGRIHRIGQTKPTFVHRFYIKNTIEEQLHEVLKTHDVSSDEEGSLTVADLQALIREGKDYSGPNIPTIDVEGEQGS